MCLDKSPQIPLRPIFSLFPFICVRAEVLIILWVFPWFSRKILDLRVQRRQHGRVLGVIFQSARDGFNVASKACEDVDRALLANHIRDDDLVVAAMLIATFGRGAFVVVGERGKDDVGNVHDGMLWQSPQRVELGECGEVPREEHA